MKNFAFAISVEEGNVLDTKLLVDIIRQNWKGNFYIAVCTSHQKLISELESCEIDAIITTEVEAHHNLLYQNMLRVDMLRKACELATQSDAPYTIYLKAGSFPLSQEKLYIFSEKMRKQEKIFAARGAGFGFYTHHTPVGQFDDSFFVFNNNYAKQKKLWMFSLLDFLPHKVAIGGFLALWILAWVGLKQFWYYARRTPKDEALLHLSPPFDYDPKFSFLQLDTQRLPTSLKYHLLAHYLKEHNLTQGKELKPFLEKWSSLTRPILEELQSIKNSFQDFFHRVHLDSQRYEYDFKKMQELQNQYFKLSYRKRILWLCQHHCNQFILQIKDAFQKRIIKGWILRYQYGDMIWPRKLNPIYKNSLLQNSTLLDELQHLDLDIQNLPTETQPV